MALISAIKAQWSDFQGYSISSLLESLSGQQIGTRDFRGKLPR